MLELIYSIVGCVVIASLAIMFLVIAGCKIWECSRIHFIRLSLESAYSQGYKDGKDSKDFSPPKHITIEQH